MIAPKTWSNFASLLLVFSFPAASAPQMTFSTWNFEWLSSQPSPEFSASQRSSADYQVLNRHFLNINSDVVAFQEVNDAQVLTKVIGTKYQMFFSERSERSNQRHQFDSINQYTGFAVRKGIEVTNAKDLRLDNANNSKLRFASYIIIDPTSNQPLHALSVHLKAGCSGRFNNSQECQTLKGQGQALNDWIRLRESKQEAYIILGDFNHNMGYQNDWLWKGISDQTRASLASKSSRADCKVKSRNNPNKTHQFRSLIDHIIVSDTLTASTPKQDVFAISDVIKHQLSDHCPLSTEIQ